MNHENVVQSIKGQQIAGKDNGGQLLIVCRNGASSSVQARITVGIGPGTAQP